jgi:hypothetical protein
VLTLRTLEAFQYFTSRNNRHTNDSLSCYSKTMPEIIVECKGFWRWCITYKITGFMNSAPLLEFQIAIKHNGSESGATRKSQLQSQSLKSVTEVSSFWGTQKGGCNLHLKKETCPVSETVYFLVIWNATRWTKSRNSVILTEIGCKTRVYAPFEMYWARCDKSVFPKLI